MKIVFCGYWGEDKTQDLLAFPHSWVGDRFCEPTRWLKKEAAAMGIDMYGESFGNYKEADVFVFWERPRPGDRVLRHALATGARRILIATEPATLIPLNADPRNEILFDEILSWYGDIGPHRHRCRPIYFAFPKEVPVSDFNDRSFCVLIASIYSRDNDPNELYSERANTVRWFAKYHPEGLVFYGRQNRYTDTDFSNYKGPVHEKLSVLSRYKFCICYENTKGYQDYISEKIFDAFFAGCIPVYWGAQEVEKYIPENCFIDRRRFASHEELYDFLSSITEAEYAEYQANVRAFLQSDFARSYTPEAFCKMMMDTILGE